MICKCCQKKKWHSHPCTMSTNISIINNPPCNSSNASPDSSRDKKAIHPRPSPSPSPPNTALHHAGTQIHLVGFPSTSSINSFFSGARLANIWTFVIGVILFMAEIRPTSWGTGSLSRYLQGFSTIPGGCLGFLKHQQYGDVISSKLYSNYRLRMRCGGAASA